MISSQSVHLSMLPVVHFTRTSYNILSKPQDAFPRDQISAETGMDSVAMTIIYPQKEIGKRGIKSGTPQILSG